MGDQHVDYRFLLANERTFLAYIRTALALQIAGLGVMQFLTKSHTAVRFGLGIALVVIGSFVGLAGYLRWRGTERSIRAGQEIQSARSPSVVAAVVVAAPLIGALMLILGA
jgi:putative membrane protein